MITLAKLKIYQQFDGDLDGWARACHGQESAGMSDEDWYLIDELLLGLAAVKAGVASASFCQQLEQRLLANTDGQAARSVLQELAERRR